MAVIVAVLLVVTIAGCINPFAPELGDLGGDLWDPQDTVGGMMRNFQLSYSIRDSIHYADIIAETFRFSYFDNDLNRYVEWNREDELIATGRMMRATDNLDLVWEQWPASLDTFALQDSTVEYFVGFHVSIGIDEVGGTAEFKARQSDDGKFRLIFWQDIN